MTVRIGVVADTHCPEFMDRLPDRVFDVLRSVDLIIHAGDVNGPGTIAALSALGPVEVVRGDHDLDSTGWPLSKEVTVEGKRIVIVHGNRNRWVEEPQTLLWPLSLGIYHPHSRLARVLRARVHQWNPTTAGLRLTQNPGWFEWSWLQLARHIRDHPQPSVGILEVSPTAMVPSVITL